ncbi:MAG: HAMP domain-containing histidine kinase [Lachnospiraceae bacterium]|nr:HAMP domain-containing histidine kinase [Lachnospiraceae bacterium]
MKRKLRISFGIVTILSLVFAILFATLVYYQAYSAHVYADLRRSLEFLVDTGELEMMQRRGYQSDYETYRITWMDPDGTVLYDNYVAADLVENQRLQKEVMQGLGTGSGMDKRKAADADVKLYWYAMRLSDGTVARIGVRAKSIWQLFQEGALPLIVIGVVLFAGGLLVGRLLTERVVAPIASLAKHPGEQSDAKIYPEIEPFVKEISKNQVELVKARERQEAFTANITHELKTPLAAISGYAQFLEKGKNSDEEQMHFGREIRKSADHMLLMVDDVLNLSKLDAQAKEPMETEWVDLNEIITTVVNDREPLAAAKKITLKKDGSLVNVKGNGVYLRQLVGNLTDNAIHYSGENTTVWLMTGLQEGRPYLEVRDQGIGIAKEDQEKIFERFYRVNKKESRKRGGTGLGLAIVKEIADMHGAEIQVESEPGVGTTMRVVFAGEGGDGGRVSEN